MSQSSSSATQKKPLLKEHFLQHPPFTVPLILCTETNYPVPVPGELTSNTPNLEIEIDERSSDIICKNGVTITHKWVEGHGDLSHLANKRFRYKMACFVEELAPVDAKFVVYVQNQMKGMRKNKSFCSFLDLLEIILKSEKYANDIIVEPRLDKLIKMTESGAASPQVSPFLKADVTLISHQQYIAMTITFLAMIFAGGERMLVFNDMLTSDIPVTLQGQDLWRLIHFCIPPFNWYFRKTFSYCLCAPDKAIPDAYQYRFGEQFATVIWLAFAHHSRTVYESLDRFLMPKIMKGSTKYADLVNEFFKRPPGTHVTPEDGRKYMHAMASGFLIKEVPSVFFGKNIDDFEETANELKITGLSLYICKSVLEWEILNSKKFTEQK